MEAGAMRRCLGLTALYQARDELGQQTLTQIVNVRVIGGTHDQVGHNCKADGHELRGVLLAGVISEEEACQ